MRQNARAFARKDVETVLALYPPRDRFLALIRQDRRRFQEAVQKTGAPLSATEPVAPQTPEMRAGFVAPLGLANVKSGISPSVAAELTKRGHRLILGRGFYGGYHAILRDKKNGVFWVRARCARMARRLHTEIANGKET